MTARVLPFPRRPHAAQRRLADVDAALSALEEERAITAVSLNRAELHVKRLREDLDSIDEDRRILERERVRQLIRLDAEARRA